MNTSDLIIPTLQTERLVLRAFSLNDAKEIQRQAGSPKIAATTLAIPHPYPDGAAEDWISRHQETFKNGHGADWAITLKSTNELIGTNPAALAPALDKLFAGQWKKGAIPEKWDGHTGKRIVQVLEKLLAHTPKRVN